MLLLNELLNAYSHYAFLAIRAVICHDDNLVTGLAHLVFQDDKVFRTTGHYAEHTIALGLQCLDDGQHRGYTQSATCADHRAIVLYASRVAQRAHHVSHRVANAQGAQFLRGQANHLHNECDGALLDVSTGNGQRHAFTFLVNAHDDKVASLAALGNQRCFNFEEENLLRELFFSNDFIHLFFV